jgi:hypothetical protein
MKIIQSQLRRIVKEELARELLRLAEAGAPTVADAESDGKKKKKGEPPPKKDVSPPESADAPAPKGGAKAAGARPEDPRDKKAPGPAKGAPPPEQELDSDPADDEISDDEADGGEEEGGEESKISKELPGKIIQSITAEPKSKVMPGAMEVVITFNDTPDPFRILIPKSGVPKFFWKGLHNEV